MHNRSLLKALVALAVLPLATACASGGNAAAGGGAAASAAPSPAVVAAGQQLFATRCQGCHGVAGVGTPRGPNLADDTWLWAQTTQPLRPQIEAVIRNGVSMPKVHMNSMPAVGAQMTAAELQSLSAYISTL